jgi:hypothetical protein
MDVIDKGMEMRSAYLGVLDLDAILLALFIPVDVRWRRRAVWHCDWCVDGVCHSLVWFG